jgi:hypothetical protein
MQSNRLNFDLVVRSQSSASSGSFALEKTIVELPESLSRTCSCPGVSGAADVLPHGLLHSARAHS